MHNKIRINFLHRLGFSAGPQSAWTLLQLLLLSPPLVSEYPVLPPIAAFREIPRVPAPLVLPAPSPPAPSTTQGSTFTLAAAGLLAVGAGLEARLGGVPRGLGGGVLDEDVVVVVDEVVVVVEVVESEAEDRAVGDGGGSWASGAGV